MKMNGALNQFCCICVKKYSHLENITESDEKRITYQFKLSVCLPNEKWRDEFNICRNCIEKLESAFDFIQMCLKSETLRADQVQILKKEIEIQKEVVESENLPQCDVCKKYFKLNRSLKLHITRVHSKENQNLVLKDYVNNQEIKLEPKIDDLPIKTNVEQLLLGYVDDTASCNDNHDDDIESNFSHDELKPQESRKRTNKRKNPLTCEYCGKIFHRRQHYSAHIRAKHTFEKPYQCDLCDAKYSTSHSLLVHKRNHNNEKPFICSYCGKGFVCSGDLSHHSKIHLNKREYKCTLCNKSFNTASILRTHKICMHTEPEEWKYICSHCSKRFPIHSSLATHLKRHTGIRQECCHICDKKFFDKFELTKHFRTHSSERLFKCNICESKEYKNRYGLRKHMKIIHDIGTIKIIKPEKKFSCPICPKVFTFNNKLKKHLCTHTGDKPFKCDICDKRFIDNYYKKIHLKKKHDHDIKEEVS